MLFEATDSAMFCTKERKFRKQRDLSEMPRERKKKKKKEIYHKCQSICLPAAQQPTMRPLRCGGGLVIRITTHPRTEPIINVMRILIGMNHLHIQTSLLQNTSKTLMLKINWVKWTDAVTRVELTT